MQERASSRPRFLLAVEASTRRREVAVMAIDGGHQTLRTCLADLAGSSADPIEDRMLYEALRSACIGVSDVHAWAFGRGPTATRSEGIDEFAEVLAGLATCYGRPFYEFSSMAGLAATAVDLFDSLNGAQPREPLDGRAHVEVLLGNDDGDWRANFELQGRLPTPLGRIRPARHRRSRRPPPDLRIECGCGRGPIGGDTPVMTLPWPRATNLIPLLQSCLEGSPPAQRRNVQAAGSG